MKFTSDSVHPTLCSYIVGMCGDGANDCGVSARHLQLVRADPPVPLGEKDLFISSC